ncbi:serine/threonine-protein kinase STY46-like isoform X3 [Durio zibethinus]|nr:serine/threonine-protein kinase STY46-like isoform X3 [Durio zibethinus]XP_022749684.1 serine/threonine-protein kinase STY46-like isoform X3 [Durio zibethinus]XP_022749696.1 serine/threonine-protein kinase STY46-like isoform X3 [Durio zibethinus]XP_022749705.1 serine/threonine-protein kinase STY46-like isoform X3 [Durio zibethinus]XP_022749715.1 serine/threonine-protein kinase STY46-like isoform X3 [Durio zibethinus]XP_022749722.1 serine/threonine-protein kinase STY46-like isoform X3 [Durio
MEGSLSGSSHSHSAISDTSATQEKFGDWEIVRRLLMMGERIASGSYGDLYHGIYFGQYVAVKILRSEHLNDALEEEFTQEVAILRVFSPNNPLGLTYYTHPRTQKKEVVKVADFGVAQFQNQGGVMTAETGTFRWMAPEVINHQPYDQKADVFSFAIVLWELVTAKVPYDNMSPLLAALGVRQGLRPDLLKNAHAKLLRLDAVMLGSSP